MQVLLRDQLSTEVGPLQWVNDQNLSGAGCADFPGVDGQSLTLDSWTSEGNLSDALWDRAVVIVAEITGEYGFGAPEVVMDRPADHEIRGTDPYGGGYQFGTARNTVLMVSTGCHTCPRDEPLQTRSRKAAQNIWLVPAIADSLSVILPSISKGQINSCDDQWTGRRDDHAI